MTFLERTLKLLDKSNTTKNKLLTDLQLSKNSFVAWEKRSTIPGGDTLSKIADYFNVSVDYLLGRTDYPEINKGQFEYNGVKQEGVIEKTTEGYIFRGEKK